MVLAAVVATTLAWGSASGFAADAVKKTELTKDERAELRNRAEKLAAERSQPPVVAKRQELTGEERTELRNRAAKLAAERAAAPMPVKSTIETTKTRKHQFNKSNKGTTPEAKQSHPKV